MEEHLFWTSENKYRQAVITNLLFLRGCQIEFFKTSNDHTFMDRAIAITFMIKALGEKTGPVDPLPSCLGCALLEMQCTHLVKFNKCGNSL